METNDAVQITLHPGVSKQPSGILRQLSAVKTFLLNAKKFVTS
jgi:hypothetical protein